MSWLKCTPGFKHGWGSPVYREIHDMEYLEEIKEEIYREYCDPEGVRAAQWEILDFPPKNYLFGKIKYFTGEIETLAKAVNRYHDMLLDISNKEQRLSDA